MPYFYCSWPNHRAPGRKPHRITDNAEAIAAFVQRWDVPGRAVYSCLNPLKAGATSRTIENVAAIEYLWADVDVDKDLEETFEQVDLKLRQLPLEPTVVRNSGGGRYPIFKLKEPIDADDGEYFARACTAMKRLAACLSADPAPTHPAALLRVVGTHNSKREGDPVLVEDLWGSGAAVDLSEIETLIDLLPETGIFTRKSAAKSNGHDTRSPFRSRQTDGPVDVEQRLADMQLHGSGNSGINITQCDVMASLLGQGIGLYEATDTVLAATRACVAGNPEAVAWDWCAEELDIAFSGARLINKDHRLLDRLPDNLREKFDAYDYEGRHPRIRKAGHKLHVVPTRPAANGKYTSSKVSDRAAETSALRNEAPTAAVDEPRKYRFKLVSFADMKPGPEPLYLVDELIPIAGLVDVWGKAKCYKSFWCLDLMLHVAMGWEYRDRYVRQGAVIYCAFEGAHGYKKRIEALRRHYNIEPAADIPLYVMPGQANLITEHRVLISDIAAQLGATKPVAVVLDTLNKSLVGSENKDIDMGNYVRAAEAIRDRFECVVIIIHHCGYDDTRPRGHSSLPGAVDAQLAVVRAENIITVTVEMMRDGPEDTQVVSAVEVVEVGQDQNGKTLTSLVVVPSETDPAQQYRDLPRGLGVFIAAVKDTLAKQGQPFQPEAGVVPVRAISQWFVRDRFYSTYAEPEEDEKKRQNKLRVAFHRALSDAQSRGMIRVLRAGGETMIWLPERGE